MQTGRVPRLTLSKHQTQLEPRRPLVLERRPPWPCLPDPPSVWQPSQLRDGQVHVVMSSCVTYDSFDRGIRTPRVRPESVLGSVSADLASQAYSSSNGESQWPILRIVSDDSRYLLAMLTSISDVAQARSLAPALETDELSSRFWLLQMPTLPAEWICSGCRWYGMPRHGSRPF